MTPEEIARNERARMSRRAEERWQGFLDAAPSPDATAAALDEQELIELSGTLRTEA